MGGFRFPVTDLDVLSFGPSLDKREELKFQGRGRSLGAEVEVTGALTDSYSEAPGVRMRLDFQHGRKLLAMLPEPLDGWLGGDPHGTVSFQGPLTRVVIDGDVDGVDANLGGLAVA